MGLAITVCIVCTVYSAIVTIPPLTEAISDSFSDSKLQTEYSNSNTELISSHTTGATNFELFTKEFASEVIYLASWSDGNAALKHQ